MPFTAANSPNLLMTSLVNTAAIESPDIRRTVTA
jgi:hypothetical protein